MSAYYTAEIHFSCTLPVNKSLQDEYACKMADKKQIADWDNFWNDAAVKAVDSDREPTCPTPPNTPVLALPWRKPPPPTPAEKEMGILFTESLGFKSE